MSEQLIFSVLHAVFPRVQAVLLGVGDDLEAGGGELVVVDLYLDLLEVAVLVLDGDVAGLAGLLGEQLPRLEPVVLALRGRGRARAGRGQVPGKIT